MKRFGLELEAFFLLVGTIVGVGMFGIPFVFAKAGFLTGLLDLVVLTVAVVIVHLAYTDVVLRTGTAHRLPGYVRSYFGAGAGFLSLASYIFGLSGSLLAYIVLGGLFLQSLFIWILPTIPATTGIFVFYILGVGVMLRGVRFEGAANGILTILLIGAIIFFGVSLLPHATGSFLTEFHITGLFIPYGVLLFSLAGAAIIPDMRLLLGRERRGLLRRVVLLGTIISAGLYFLFAVAVVGITGISTTPDALLGITHTIGGGYLLAGTLIGFLAAITSFIPLGTVFHGVLNQDAGLPTKAAWLVVVGVPPLLWAVGFQDFIQIVSIIGAFGIGLDSIFILAMHQRLPRADGGLSIPRSISGILALMFIAGIVVEVIRFL
jgi:amino acid permease